MVPGLYSAEVLRTIRAMNVAADVAVLEDNGIAVTRRGEER
jgi:hypothetical protein